MAPVLAHAGHWTSAVVYLAPMLIVAIYQGVAALRRRRGRGERASPNS